jgi:hypothetical protein
VTIRQPPKRLSDTPSGRAEHALQTANAVSQIIAELGTFQPLDDQLTSLAELDYTGNAGKVIAVTAGADGFELVTGGGGGGGTTTNALTINNSGSGAASGATFNGSAAVTISYNTVGAAASTHDHDADYLQLSGGTLTGDLSVPDEAYGSGWNGSAEVPTKNAIYDKIESLGSGAGATYVQSAGKRINGSAVHNAVLGATPTVGNILIYIGVGFPGGSWNTLLPTGFTLLQGATPVSNQAYRVAFRVVESGDGTTWGYTTTGGANDVGGFVIVEASNMTDILISAGGPTNSGSNLSTPCFDGGSSYFTITGFERDNTGTYSSVSGASLLFDATGGGVNHPAVFVKSTTTFGTATVTMSSGSSDPEYVTVKCM